ncbi:MAG: phosphatidylserine/phosphatidylglycerophosphate/cardiolipin synthase family protein [Bacteroidales bacterium]|nr:phosphatidylserine/phosphatidylglycerophosphate/cardiolipin synthase family protein [Bacteroidales bacterium]
MNCILALLIGAALLGAPSDSTDTVYIDDATPLVKAEFRNLARMLAISPGYVPTSGNDFELITSGKHYGELLYNDFRSAQNLIELELFLFGQDDDGAEARDILFERIKEGVEVRYTHDNFGNFFDNIFDGRKVFTGYYTNLAKGGFNMRNFAKWWRMDPTFTSPGNRNHRKINIIDKQIAYTGGMNITEGSISGWGDAHLRITGPAVQCLRSILLLNWNDLATRKSEIEKLDINLGGNPVPGGKILQVVPDGADQPAYMAEDAMVWVLDHARDYVWFETPYFLPTRALTNALKRAAGRGVDVRVIIPTDSDLPALDPAFRSCLEECVKGGVSIMYRRPPFNHSKTFLCDDYLTCVGSTNLDKLSLKRLYEVNVYIYDQETALQRKAYLIDAQEGATPADQAMFDAWDGSERLKQFIFGFASPWL